MTPRVGRDKIFYAFDPRLEPALTVKQGEAFTLETHDCFQGQICSEQDLTANLDWEDINPATGPVYIEGIQPGDVVKLELRRVKVAEQGVITAIPGAGAMPDLITRNETAVLKVKGESLDFKGKLDLPLKPMIGVIGFAPASGSIANGTPDYHGGNMDCKLIGEGASLYLKANVAGGLLGAGDFHAVMGDGEVLVAGAEIAGETTIVATRSDIAELPTPFLVTDDLFVTIFSADTLDDAATGATYAMSRFLTDVAGLDQNDAAMLMSLIGDLKICQVVDPKKTARFEFPRAALEKLGCKVNL